MSVVAPSGLVQIRLRFSKRCALCHDHQPPGVRAWWDPIARTILCAECRRAGRRRPI